MRETFILLALAAANSGIAMRMVEPMLPRLATDFATPIPVVASVITAFAFAQAAAQYFHGPLGDRYGKLRMVTILMALSAVSALGCVLAADLESLIAWRFATGLFASGSMVLGMAFLSDAVPAERRQPVLARFVSGTIIGQSLGPLVGGAVTDLAGWRASFVVLGAVFAAVAVVLFVRTRRRWDEAPRSPGPVLSPAVHLAVLRVPRARAVIVAVFLETVFFFGPFSFLSPMLKAKFDLPLSVIGILLAGFGLGGMVYIAVVRVLLARLGQRGCVTVGGLLCGLFYLAVLVVPWWPLAMVCTVGVGFAFYMVHNTLQTRAAEMAPHARATGFSQFSMAWAAGQAVGVAAMGAGVTVVGYAWMIGSFALAFTALALVLRVQLHRL
ncbi:MAG: MFS transporter [Burkholderiales bacterium]|nr:MFS transporter [Burkholderiales bacterium]